MATLKGFSEGRHEYRPAPFWSWNDKLNGKELLSQMKKMNDAGYGGFFMHSRVGLITPYLSEEWMNFIRLCAEQSAQYGLDACLYDEDMWPSGYASGAVPAMSDDFKEKALVLVHKEELRPTDEIFRELRRGGETLYIARRTCAAGMVRFNGQCYIDTLNPAAIRAFLQSTHEKYKEQVGDLFGKTIRSIFTDEPCYGIHWFYEMPHVPYSESLERRIEAEKGYNIREHCEKLFFDEGDYKKIRYDYYSCAGRQFCDSFTKQYADWCSENRLAFTGHLMAEETMYEQAQWTGGVMQNYAYMQQPGVDKLMRANTQLVTLKQLTSVSEQLNKERALSECFAGLGHESGFYKRKEIMDWQAINGINFVNMHLSHYSLRGERKRDYPPDIFYQQPYFTEEKLFSDYASRLSQLAAYGKRAVRVLIVQPLYSVFAGYSPAEQGNQERLAVYDELFAGLSQALQNDRIDFHYGDETVLREFANIENGLLKIGNYVYDTIVLCHCESLEKRTVELLNAYAGRIFVLGQKPSLCEYREKIEVRSDAQYREIGPLVTALKDCRFAFVEGEGVIGCRRIAEEGDVLLFANPSGRSVELRAECFRGAYALDLTAGCAYLLEREDVTLLPGGSFAMFTGTGQMLEKWGVPLILVPPLSADGVMYTSFAERKVPVPAARVCDENALPLDRADFESGDVVLRDTPLEAVWHYHFYKLPEGTPYMLRYRFYVSRLPEKPVQIAVENAENADSLLLNGVPVRPMRRRGEEQYCDDKAYKDLSFTRCEVCSLRTGWNELELRAKKINNITDVCCHRPVYEKNYCPTEAEAACVIGDFKVQKGVHGYEIAAKGQAPVSSAESEGYPFYSGVLEYETECCLSGNELLYLHCDCAYASVEAAGRKLVAGVNPYVYDLRGLSGDTKIRIRLSNTLFALLGPHHIRGYDELNWVDAGVFNDLSRYENENLIKPFGLKEIKIIQGVER